MQTSKQHNLVLAFGGLVDLPEILLWRNVTGLPDLGHTVSGITLVTPEQVHYGLPEEITLRRAAVLAAAYEKFQKRFKNKTPVPDTLPKPNKSRG